MVGTKLSAFETSGANKNNSNLGIKSVFYPKIYRCAIKKQWKLKKNDRKIKPTKGNTKRQRLGCLLLDGQQKRKYSSGGGVC